MAEKKSKNIDIWLVGVIIVLVLGFGGGLWMLNKSVHARLDQIYLRTDSKLSQARSEIFALGNQIHTLNMRVAKLLKRAGLSTAGINTAKPAPAADKGADKKGGDKKSGDKKGAAKKKTAAKK